MPHFAPYLVGGLVAVLAMDYAPSASKPISALSGMAWMNATTATQVDRSRKANRQVAARVTEAMPDIAIVEVVGLRNAAIVYRDRDGRELYRTDPVSNVTIVTKGLLLPEVTVRQHTGSVVTPVPVTLPREQARERPSPRPKVKTPLGCEPAFSPVAQPSLAHHTGRCMASLDLRSSSPG